MGGRRHVPVGREMREMGLHLGCAHFARMAHAVKAHVGAHPMDVLLFRA
jgi:hypothetical protein